MYLYFSIFYVKPCSPVYFRKLAALSRVRRPLHREMITFDKRRIAVAFEFPGLHDFAAGLFYRIHWYEMAGRFDAGLFLKFPLRCSKLIFARSKQALGY